jgi:hypothetical protein
MRSYPKNSPEAAARLVALVLIADGNVCRTEHQILACLDVSRAFGLAANAMPDIVQTLCEDLLPAGFNGGSLLANVDEDTLASLMGEVTEPALQRSVLFLATAAARAYSHLADGETLVLEAARRHWNLVYVSVSVEPPPAVLHPA